jgi:uncharacterized protein (DUF1501 family)
MNHASFLNRRTFLKGLAGSYCASLPYFARAQHTPPNDRILVVLELSGGNDGLNSVVPYGDDAYYRHRPRLGIKPKDLLTLDDHFGFNPGMLGFKRLWDDNQLAIFHGCGYDNPSYSHFTSMAWMHTAAPNSGAEFGWVGRLADHMAPSAPANFIVNIDASRSLAVHSARHIPVVFDNPGDFQQRQFGPMPVNGTFNPHSSTNEAHRFLLDAASSGQQAAQRVRQAWERYQPKVDYGIMPLDLNTIAACIDADLPARLYYTSFRNNAFDTHVQQGPLHQRLLSYACDAVHGFIRDLERLGHADRVVVLIFSEFGRRIAENTNRGSDHGTANTWFLAGKPVQGGHYGEPPSLTTLREDENLVPTTDFRRVYATAIDWVAPGLSDTTLESHYAPFPALNS